MQEPSSNQQNPVDGSSDSGSSGMSTAHFAFVAVDEPAGTPPPASIPGQEVIAGEEEAPKKDFVTVEKFHRMFSTVFNVTGTYSGLNTLKIAENEQEAANEAATALYEIAIEVPFLNFLAESKSGMAENFIALAGFGYFKYQAVSAEIRERRKVKNEVNSKNDLVVTPQEAMQ
ncbi:MAG: hypothetical protein HQL69_20470 [Magnetococcales bacterium]|nr:hypothetical protein [Magnetococcales bacterium]